MVETPRPGWKNIDGCRVRPGFCTIIKRDTEFHSLLVGKYQSRFAIKEAALLASWPCITQQVTEFITRMALSLTFPYLLGVVAQSPIEAIYLKPQPWICHGWGLRTAQFSETIQYGCPDKQLVDLVLKGA